jgi:hypothetical protein
MNLRSLPRLALLSLILAVGVRAASTPSAEPGLKPIFNGKDFTGWKVIPEPNIHWKIVNGVIVAEDDPSRKGSYLWTEKSYQDFVLELDVRWFGAPEDIDTGVNLRKPSFQVQMGTSRSLGKDMTASMLTDGVGHPTRYPEAGRAKDWEKYFKKGDWNSFRIQATGSNFKVWVNGHLTTDYTEPKWAGAAPLGLQFHDGVKMRVEFRNIRLAEL